MDDREREILERLDRVEQKLDAVVTFTGSLQQLLTAWLSGGRGKLLTTLARVKTGGPG